MTKHVSGVLADYLLGRLQDDDRARVTAHLAGCRDCRDELAWLEGFRASARTDDVGHLAPERLVAVADGAGPDFDSIERNHLVQCADCRADLEWARAHATGPRASGRRVASRRRRGLALGGLLAAAVLALVVFLPRGGQEGDGFASLARLTPLPTGVTRTTLDPASFEGRREAGLVAYSLTNYERAAEEFRTALAIRPTDPASRLYLASSLALTGQGDQAEPLLREMIDGDESATIHAEARWLLVQVLLASSRAGEARSLLLESGDLPTRHREDAERLLKDLGEGDDETRTGPGPD